MIEPFSIYFDRFWIFLAKTNIVWPCISKICVTFLIHSYFGIFLSQSSSISSFEFFASKNVAIFLARKNFVTLFRPSYFSAPKRLILSKKPFFAKNASKMGSQRKKCCHFLASKNCYIFQNRLFFPLQKPLIFSKKTFFCRKMPLKDSKMAFRKENWLHIRELLICFNWI